MKIAANIADRLDMGLIVLDHDVRIRVWNRWMEQHADTPSSQAMGKPLRELFAGHMDPRITVVIREALDFGWPAKMSHALHPTPLPLFTRGNSNERIKQAIDITPMEQPDGKRMCLIQIRNVSEIARREQLLRQQARMLRTELEHLHAAQVELQRSELRFRELARQAPAGIFETDAVGRWTFLNERCMQLAGLTHGNGVGENWLNILPETDRERVQSSWMQARDSATRFAEEFRLPRMDGGFTWIRCEAGQMRDENGRLQGFIGTFTDITEFRERAMRNEFRANHDSLTLLCNRERFELKLRAAVSGAREIGNKLALLYIDLDGFKGLNDEYGHAAGDTALRSISSRLRRVMRNEDIIARLGGDEFAVLVTDYTDERMLASVMAKISQAVALPINIGPCHVRLGCSIGVSLYPDHAQDAAQLLSHADQAMYTNKRQRKESQQKNQQAAQAKPEQLSNVLPIRNANS